MGMLLLCLELSAQNVQYKVNHAGAATTYTPQQVASDFGPRMLSKKDGVLKYDWHGGVDYSAGAGDSDKGYTILALEDGTISYIHKLGRIGFKYIRVDGAHHYGYGHIFTSKDGVQSSGDFKLVQLLVPHSTLYAIYNTQTQQLFHTCKNASYVDKPCSEFKYIEGTDTIMATNQVVTGSEIGPVGTSIDGKKADGTPDPDAAVEAHLHLYNFGTVNNNTASDVADGNTLNPLQFATHTAPAYTVNVYKNSGFTQEGIGLVYPGTGSTKAGVRVRMANQNGGGNYSAVMNIDKVKLYISKGDEAYKVLEGLNYESRVDYGGRTDAPDHYPAVNSANVLTKTGEWGTGAAPGVNGIVPKAYRSQPEDDFCFTDFVTRLHKAHVPGSAAQYTSCPAEAKYPDGRYKLKARVISINGDSTDSAVSPFLLDNYKPYISQVSMSVKGKQCYDAGWELKYDYCLVSVKNSETQILSDRAILNKLSAVGFVLPDSIRERFDFSKSQSEATRC